MRVRRLAILRLSSIAVVGGAFTAACGSDGGTTPASEAGPTEGGTTDIGQPSPNEAKQSGRIVGALDRLEIEGVTVTIDGRSATTKADGTYEIIVPKNKP